MLIALVILSAGLILGSLAELERLQTSPDGESEFMSVFTPWLVFAVVWILAVYCLPALPISAYNPRWD